MLPLATGYQLAANIPFIAILVAVTVRQIGFWNAVMLGLGLWMRI
jgi:hypothetical protein